MTVGVICQRSLKSFNNVEIGKKIAGKIRKQLYNRRYGRMGWRILHKMEDGRVDFVKYRKPNATITDQVTDAVR